MALAGGKGRPWGVGAAHDCGAGMMCCIGTPYTTEPHGGGGQGAGAQTGLVFLWQRPKRPWRGPPHLWQVLTRFSQTGSGGGQGGEGGGQYTTTAQGIGAGSQPQAFFLWWQALASLAISTTPSTPASVREIR